MTRTRHGTARWFAPALACALLIALAPAPIVSSAAHAQSDEDEQTLITTKCVDVLTRVYLTRVRSLVDPAREDLRATALALRIIRRLAPDDVDLLRLEIEAWTTAGDDQEAIAVTRELVRLEPDDEVAQLRLTLAGIDRLQNADARLNAYRRMLGPKGRMLDPAVRSRLALDAALLARDNGDEAAFLEHLTLATSLDPTNKDAAAAFGTYVLGRVDDAKQRVEVLANIALSDPLDSGSFENLALELLRYGAYSAALRSFRLATQVAMASGWTMSVNRVFDLALCEWRVLGPAQGLARIMAVVRDSLAAEEQRRARVEAEGLDPGPIRPLWLPPELDLLRLAIAVAEGHDEGITAVLDAFLSASDAHFELVMEQEPSTPAGRRDWREGIRIIKLQRLWTILFSGQKTDEARALFEEILAEDEAKAKAVQGAEEDLDPALEADPGSESESDAIKENPPPLDELVVQRFNGWLAVLEGRDRDAEDLLAPLVEDDDSARWALGVLLEAQGRDREAMLQYAHLALENTRSALGSAAWFRLVKLRGKPLNAPPLAQELDEYIMNLAPWMDQMASNPASFMSIEVRHVETDIDPMGVVKIEVSVRNTSRWPLSVGSDRAIPKRILLAPNLRLRGLIASELADPVVVLISNRLRLEPGERVTVLTIPTREQLGRLFDLTPTARASLRWQAVQGFVKEGQSGGFRAGSMTVTTLSDVLTRTKLDGTVSSEDLAARITVERGVDLLRSVMLARRRISDALQEEQADPATARSLMGAITRSIGNMSETERAITLAWLAEAGIGKDDAFSDDLRQAIDHAAAYPALAVLVAFIDDPDDPRLQDLVASSDDDLSRLAFLVREHLRARRAELDPGPEAETDAEVETSER